MWERPAELWKALDGDGGRTQSLLRRVASLSGGGGSFVRWHNLISDEDREWAEYEFEIEWPTVSVRSSHLGATATGERPQGLLQQQQANVAAGIPLRRR